MSIATTKNFVLSGGTAPYTWSFSSDIACASIETPTGISIDGKINATIVYDTAECVTASTITLTVVDANGCSSSQEVVVPSLCSQFTINDITKTGDFTLSCSGTDSQPYLQFVWSYDTSLFTVSSKQETATTSQITLSPIAGKVIPANTIVSVTVYNSVGCTLEKSFILPVCSPNAPSKAVVATCDADDSNYVQAVVDLSNVGTNCTTSVDWTTLQLVVPDQEKWYSHSFNTTDKKLTINATNLSTATYTLSYTVKNVYGVLSNVGYIFVTIPSCVRVAPVLVETPIRKAPTVSPGDIVSFRLDDKVATTKDIDWSTFTVLNTPASPSVTVEADIAGGIYMKYEVPALNPDDIVTWTVSDVDGTQAAPASIAVVTSDAAPTAVADTVGVVWGESTVKDVLLNDTVVAPLDVTSVTVTSQSQVGLTAVKPTGEIEVFGLTHGIDIFKYTVKDIYGNESNEANVGVQVFYAGDDVETDLCTTSPATVNITPYNYLTAPEGVYINIGGTWTLTSSPGVSPAAPGTWNGSITFNPATHTYGDHVYTYSVTVYGVTATATVTITFQSYIAAVNVSCATASVLAFNGRNSSITHSGYTNKTTCPGQGAIPGSGVAIPAQWGAGTFNSDLWYSFTAPGDTDNYPITITVSGSSYSQTTGIYAPAIAIYTGTCAGLTLASANIANVTNQSISTSVVVNSATPVTYYVRVDSQNGYEGSYDITISAS